MYKQKYVYRYQRDNQMPEIEGLTMQCPKAKGQIMIYKTLGRKLKIEQDEPSKHPSFSYPKECRLSDGELPTNAIHIFSVVHFNNVILAITCNIIYIVFLYKQISAEYMLSNVPYRTTTTRRLITDIQVRPVNVLLP